MVRFQVDFHPFTEKYIDLFAPESDQKRLSPIKIFQLAWGPSPVSCSAGTHPTALRRDRLPVSNRMFSDKCQTACHLLVLAEKYQVQHLKVHCEKFLVSKLNWENSVLSYTFAHQHNAKHIIDSALTLITDNMDKLTTREEYVELVEKDPRLVVEI
ncbi:hypothetical protein ACFXTI_017028 [Malus domestica]